MKAREKRWRRQARKARRAAEWRERNGRARVTFDDALAELKRVASLWDVERDLARVVRSMHKDPFVSEQERERAWAALQQVRKELRVPNGSADGSL